MKIAIAYALATLFAWGAWGYFSKLAALRIEPYSALCYAIISKAFIGAGIVVYEPGAFGLSTQTAAVMAMAAGVSLMAGTYLQFWAMRDGVGGVVVTITSLYPVLVITLYPALSLLFEAFEQNLTVLDGLGLSLALTGTYFIVGGDSG